MFSIICDDMIINYDTVQQLSMTEDGNMYVDYGDTYIEVTGVAPNVLGTIAKALASNTTFVELDGAHAAEES